MSGYGAITLTAMQYRAIDKLYRSLAVPENVTVVKLGTRMCNNSGSAEWFVLVSFRDGAHAPDYVLDENGNVVPE